MPERAGVRGAWREPGVNGKRVDMQRISIGVVPPVFRSPAVFGAVREKETGGLYMEEKEASARSPARSASEWRKQWQKRNW